MATAVSVARVAWLSGVYRRIRGLRLPWVSLVIVTMLLVCAVFAPLLAPHDPTQISMLDSNLAPGETLSYPLGTDVMGRGMLSRLIYGSRTALFMALVALGSGALVGTLLGLISGYRGGWADALIMRVVVMYSSVLVAYLIMRTERLRRREAVSRERVEAASNLELQHKAQQAELRAAEERFRIGRDIHDGIAQNLYGLTLNLESAADTARSGNMDATSAKLDMLLPLAKQALLETRHYMHDLRPMPVATGSFRRRREGHRKAQGDPSYRRRQVGHERHLQGTRVCSHWRCLL